MDLNYEAIEEKLKNLENDKYAMLLVKAYESSLVFNSVAEKHIESLKPKNITMKNYARDALSDIIDELDKYSHGDYFSDELTTYIGFDVDDDRIGDIWYKCCHKGKTDIKRLKQESLDHLIFLQFPKKYGHKVIIDNEEFYIKNEIERTSDKVSK